MSESCYIAAKIILLWQASVRWSDGDKSIRTRANVAGSIFQYPNIPIIPADDLLETICAMLSALCYIPNEFLNLKEMEAAPGVEPGKTELQSVPLPLG